MSRSKSGSAPVLLKSRSSSPVSRSPKPPFKAPPKDFVNAFYAYVLPADLAFFSAEERARIVASIWAGAAQRLEGEVIVRVFNPTITTDGWTVDHTVIEVICDDMPFLVESVTGVLQNLGFSVHIAIHPVVSLRRDKAGKILGVEGTVAEAKKGRAESFMHVQIDRCLDSAQLKLLEDEVLATLADVHAAVSDWGPMRARLQEAVAEIDDAQSEEACEATAFLRWMADDNFTFLGYREIELKLKGDEVASIRIVPKRGLGTLRDDDARMFGGVRDMNGKSTPTLLKYHHERQIISIIKTQQLTRVHRVLPMDAIFVRRFNGRGLMVSEKLFVGLFTSKAYAQMPRDIPLVRSKIDHVLARMNFLPKSHNGRNFLHILNTYPRDELFQIREDELCKNALGILQLQGCTRVALFLRRDPYDHFVTFLVYVPRDLYNSTLRLRVQKLLEKAYNGKALAWNVQVDNNRLARAFITIRLTPESLHPDIGKLEAEVRELCRTWSGRLRDSLVEAHGEARALELLRLYGDAFPQSYCEAVGPGDAVADINDLERLREGPRFIARIDEVEKGRAGGPLRLKLVQPGQPLLLSESLPVIENMGLKVDYMGGPYEIKTRDGAPAYIHEFVGKPALPLCAPFDAIKPLFEEALTRVWSGDVENDEFNALTLRTGLNASAVVVLRSFARYLRQLRIPYSHEMIAAALLAYPSVTERLYALFRVRHDPSFKGNRPARMIAIEKDLLDSFGAIKALEEERIVRRYLNLVQASLRTNYFQRDESGAPKACLSIKYDSRSVDYMPLPKPLFEVFVYSPRTEAIHLRGGKVARGGIRWSDRRDDFRNEILSLMKAQMVKNTVIVPVGSKGGFIVKHPPAEAAAAQAEGVACYKIMMRGLLDITDNYKNGKVVPPQGVVRHDSDDPYLVVAADKGTARFSDIANGLSREYGFWLDDAFASGGSAGYDHKEMGITARGAWEAVKRHFRELGKDIQKEEFTAVGVGDMSGDVFGNGALLSPHMRLLGAFDHRHIFCDPHPDAAKSYAERKRLFALSHSSWSDYDRRLISKGGGVFSRSEKVIKITPEMKKAYDISADVLPPAELMRALLKTEAELIYFGGIGTYVKASDETHDDVSDRANDPVRVNGAELRAKVIGEGANLGMTQRGRIEFAQKGGRLNTDAVDNSAGVDTSDHEVNIKILLRRAVDQKKLTLPARNKLLASMTNDIARLVLRDNYLQTLMLSVSETQSAELFQAHVRCMRVLEKAGLLNRGIEFLPLDGEIAERQNLGKGMTRPEMAVLMGYAKLWLYEKILESALPDDPALKEDIDGYFPAALRRAYGKDISRHQLRREIAATVVTNDIINHAGIQVILPMAEEGRVETVIRAYLLARDALGLPQLWAQIEALDNKVPASVQTRLYVTAFNALGRAMERLAANPENLEKLVPAIALYKKGLEPLGKEFARAPDAALGLAVKDMRAAGVPEVLAKTVLGLPFLVDSVDVIALSAKSNRPVSELAALFYALDRRLEIGALCRLAQNGQTPWQNEATALVREKLALHLRRLTAGLASRKGQGAPLTVEAWAAQNAARLERYDAVLAEARVAGGVDLALLLLANERLNELSA